MPELAIRCIESWHRFLPEYTFTLWNEDNFDIDSVPYVQEAYNSKKYAFVTDYIRLYALYHFGGVYMDTDVEVLKPFGDLLELPAFSGYESNQRLTFPTGMMASAPKGKWVTEQLAYYDDRHFLLPDGSLDMTTNAIIITNIMVANGFELTGKYQVYKDDMHCFPNDYFCPLTSTRVLKLTENSYCIHHFAGSWQNRSRLWYLKHFIYKNILGYPFVDWLVRLKRKIFK
jgi:mannosyltransferase OCH1-like enzyme